MLYRIITFFLVLSGPLMSQYSSRDNAITVVGQVESATPSDQAKIYVPIEVTGSSLSESLSKATALISSISSRLIGIGIRKDELETPTFSDTKNVDASIFTSKRDFITNATLVVTINDLNTLENAVILLADAKAEPSTITFHLKDPEGAKIRAVGEATLQAQLKAKEIATRLGISLGSVLSVQESSTSDVRADNVIVVAERPLNLKGGRVSPIMPEKKVIRSTVLVTFSILR